MFIFDILSGAFSAVFGFVILFFLVGGIVTQNQAILTAFGVAAALLLLIILLALCRTRKNAAKQPRKVTTNLAGVTKSNASGTPIQQILRTVTAGREICLVREPQNPYDPNAIAVYYGSAGIGYIKAELARELAPLIDSGAVIHAKVVRVTGGRNRGCTVELTIPQDAEAANDTNDTNDQQ